MALWPTYLSPVNSSPMSLPLYPFFHFIRHRSWIDIEPVLNWGTCRTHSLRDDEDTAGHWTIFGKESSLNPDHLWAWPSLSPDHPWAWLSLNLTIFEPDYLWTWLSLNPDHLWTLTIFEPDHLWALTILEPDYLWTWPSLSRCGWRGSMTRRQRAGSFSTPSQGFFDISAERCSVSYPTQCECKDPTPFHPILLRWFLDALAYLEVTLSASEYCQYNLKCRVTRRPNPFK